MMVIYRWYSQFYKRIFVNLANIVLFVITISESYSSSAAEDLPNMFAQLYGSKSVVDFKQCFQDCYRKKGASLNITKHLIRDGHVDLLAEILANPFPRIPPAIIFDDRGTEGDKIRFLVKYEEHCVPRNNGFTQAEQATDFNEALQAISKIEGLANSLLKIGRDVELERLMKALVLYTNYKKSLSVYSAIKFLIAGKGEEETIKNAYTELRLIFIMPEWTNAKSASDSLFGILKNEKVFDREFVFKTRKLKVFIETKWDTSQNKAQILAQFKKNVEEYIKYYDFYCSQGKKTDVQFPTMPEFQLFTNPSLITLDSGDQVRNLLHEYCKTVLESPLGKLPEIEAVKICMESKLFNIDATPEKLLVPTILSVLSRSIDLMVANRAIVTLGDVRDQKPTIKNVGVTLKVSVTPEEFCTLIGKDSWGPLHRTISASAVASLSVPEAITPGLPAVAVTITTAIRSDAAQQQQIAPDSHITTASASFLYKIIDPYLATFFPGTH